MMCKLTGRMDTGKHYDVEMKGWMDERCFRPLLCTIKAELGWGQPWGNKRVDAKRGHYYVQIKRGDGKGRALCCGE